MMVDGEEEEAFGWDTYYLPGEGFAGWCFAVQAYGFDRAGNKAVSESAIVRIEADRPPEITIKAPVDKGEVTEDQDMRIYFSVYDDLNIFVSFNPGLNCAQFYLTIF